MNRRVSPATVSILLLILVSAAVSAQDDPATLLRNAALLGRFSTLELHFTLEITERRGSKERDLVAYVEQNTDGNRALVQVVAPAFLSNLKFLSVTSGDNRDQWMSTSRGVRRVAAGNRNERLFDSDFTVEDLSHYDPADYDLSIIGTESVNGTECTVLQAVPADNGSFGDRKVLYISTDNGLLYAAEFYADGEIERRFELIDTMMIDGTPFPHIARMSTIADDTNTLLTVTEANVGVDIPDRYFNRGNL